jgi:hypothetical protein
VSGHDVSSFIFSPEGESFYSLPFKGRVGVGMGFPWLISFKNLYKMDSLQDLHNHFSTLFQVRKKPIPT